MSKYIDADKLIAEIEKRLKNVRDYMNGAGMKYKGPKYFKAQGKESSYDALLSLITSLQQEQPEPFSCGHENGSEPKPEVDLITEYDERFDSDPVYRKLVNRSAGIAIARHFWNKGYNTRKEE